jgi:hypothetical protein
MDSHHPANGADRTSFVDSLTTHSGAALPYHSTGEIEDPHCFVQMETLFGGVIGSPVNISPESVEWILYA